MVKKRTLWAMMLLKIVTLLMTCVAQVVGMVSLKALVNGQALGSQAAFLVDGGPEGVSVDTLLARAAGEGVELGGHARGGTEAAYSKVLWLFLIPSVRIELAAFYLFVAM